MMLFPYWIKCHRKQNVCQTEFATNADANRYIAWWRHSRHHCAVSHEKFPVRVYRSDDEDGYCY